MKPTNTNTTGTTGAGIGNKNTDTKLGGQGGTTKPATPGQGTPTPGGKQAPTKPGQGGTDKKW